MTQCLENHKNTFNSLPLEIIREIFCNIDSEELFDLKCICSYWYNIITELLDIQQCKVSSEMENNALEIFGSQARRSDGSTLFFMYRSSYHIRNIVNRQIINRQCRGKLVELQTIDYLLVLGTLQKHVTDYTIKHTKCKDPIESVWKTVLGMTGSAYSVRDFRDKSFQDEFVKSFMTKYTWYVYTSSDSAWVWDAGFISLHPDNRTYSMLFSPAYE